MNSYHASARKDVLGPASARRPRLNALDCACAKENVHRTDCFVLHYVRLSSHPLLIISLASNSVWNA